MIQDNSFFNVESLSKSFGGLRAVDKVSFCVRKGSLTSLIGPNGAGKTTVFDLISGFLPPDEGRVLFKGNEVLKLKAHEIVSLGMARTFQHIGLFTQLSIWDNVFLAQPGKLQERLWGAFLPSRTRMKISPEKEASFEKKTYEILHFLGLSEKSGEVVANLSWGDQKMVSIGRLLATDGEFLLLDEPASGLSDEQITHLKSLLKGLVSMGKTILLIDHNVDAVLDISDWVIVLDFGKIIAEGTPNEIRANEEVIRVYLGV
jgi:ABC-type branched-subunit amino acid transport system ATPase component